MKRFMSSAVLSVLAFASLAVEPLYIKHDYIKGSMPIMTNVESFVNGSIEIASEKLQAQIDNISTNPASIASNIIEVAVRASTNYTDKVIADGNFATKAELPTKTSQLQNDGDGTMPFLTEHQSLADYPTKEELNNATNDLAIGLNTSIYGAADSSTNYTDTATNALASDIRLELSAAATGATNLTVSATNDVMKEVALGISASATESTNYTDSATNEVARLMDSAVSAAATQATNYTDLATSDLATTGVVAAVAENLSTNYYSKSETDDAIDTLAAYYITSNANGEAFATLFSLTNATVYYSGGVVRTPTRNDYAVVLADETHGGSEWRYIYTVAEGATQGQWDAQYPIETNDYEGLGNKPQINGNELAGDKTAAQLGLATPADITTATNDLSKSLALITTNDVENIGDSRYVAFTQNNDGYYSFYAHSITFGPYNYNIGWNEDGLTLPYFSSPYINAQQGGIDITSQAAFFRYNGVDVALASITNDLPTSSDIVNATNSLHTSLAFTIASAATSATNYTDAVSASKQDNLPYPTNAIPAEAVLGIDFTADNPVLVATIQATSPAPGNYSAVSNAAMSAVQPDALPPLTNGLISASYIATNNPAFVEAVTNCPVVVAGGSGEDGDDDSPFDFAKYGTIGALLAAVAAAATWLKSNKMDSTSAAPAYDATKTYVPGDHVTDNGTLYECIEAASGTWDASKWKATDMTSPDATLDITNEGRLSVVSGQGEIMWMEGYGLSNTSSSALVCNAVQLFAFPATTATPFSSDTDYAEDDRVIYDGKIYKFNAEHLSGAWIGTDAVEDPDIQEFTLPTPPAGIVGDFVLDIDNSANPDAEVKADLAGVFTNFDVITPKGEVLTDMLTFAGGEMCELDFTSTAFGSSGKPAWKVVKQVVEKV